MDGKVAHNWAGLKCCCYTETQTERNSGLRLECNLNCMVLVVLPALVVLPLKKKKVDLSNQCMRACTSSIVTAHHYCSKLLHTTCLSIIYACPGRHFSRVACSSIRRFRSRSITSWHDPSHPALRPMLQSFWPHHTCTCCITRTCSPGAHSLKSAEVD
jgi:hypothetical protein